MLKQELIAVQQRMNDLALENEREIEDFEEIFRRQTSLSEKFFATNFNIKDEIETIDSSIKLFRDEKRKVEAKIQSLRNYFEELKRSKIEMKNDFLKQIEDLREERSQLVQMKINDDENEERQNLFRFVTQEKVKDEQN